MSSVAKLAGRFPFRLGCTSYVVPADIEPNVNALAGLVDDVEVVLFESEEFSNLPDNDVINTLDATAGLASMSFTIHLPLDIRMGAESEAERQRSVLQCLRIMTLTQPLTPFGYILHLHPDARDIETATSRRQWQNRCVQSIQSVLDNSKVPPGDICVENLSFPFEFAFPVVDRLGLSVCMDVGHVLLNSYNLQKYYDDYFNRARVIHLHGLSKGKDHQSLAHLPSALLSDLIHRLSASDKVRVLTMEVFGIDDFVSSMAVMEGALSWEK